MAPRKRSALSGQKAGRIFERQIADCFALWVDDRIDRRVQTGAKDKGDIGGIRHMGGRVVVECKDVRRMALGEWITEADIERGNDDALVGLVVHKRVGKGNPLDQYVTCTMRDLIALLTGERPPEDGMPSIPDGDDQ